MFRRRLVCSFCRRDETEVGKLVAGPKVYICDRCVSAASEIMAGHGGGQRQHQETHRGLAARLLSWLRDTHRRAKRTPLERRTAEA